MSSTSLLSEGLDSVLASVGKEKAFIFIVENEKAGIDSTSRIYGTRIANSIRGASSGFSSVIVSFC